MTLEEFAKFIELSLHQLVVNQTGLEGNFRVDFTPDESVPRFYRPQNANAAGGG